MFKVTIIKLKDILKCLLSLAIVIVAIFVGKRYFFDSEKVSSKALIDMEMPEIKKVQKAKEKKDGEIIDENNDNADSEFLSKFFTQMINMELSLASVELQNEDNKKEYIETSKKEQNEDTKEKENTKNDGQDSDEIILAKTNVQTEIITKNPIKESFTDKYKGVKIKNETKYEIKNDEINIDNLDIDKSNILIFHTHTCESYTSSKKYSYKLTGNFRTTDLNYSVARVGDELEKYMKNYGFNVIHNKTSHDYPSYSGSYTRSLSTVSDILKSNKADIIIDLHRDAIGSNSSYAPTVKIDNEECAQIMLVIGTNGGGLKHDNWKSNLSFAIKVQQKANELYPGLFKPIILRNSRYNQHLGKAACIIEVGSTGNTLEQAINSMKYLAEVMKEF